MFDIEKAIYRAGVVALTCLAFAVIGLIVAAHWDHIEAAWQLAGQ
jgi:hypothetical protein